jgi:hypothetical protein
MEGGGGGKYSPKHRLVLCNTIPPVDKVAQGWSQLIRYSFVSFSDILYHVKLCPEYYNSRSFFVRRLRYDLDEHFSGYITLLGTGGRTVKKVVKLN